MATTLTTSYKKIGSISTSTYSQLRFYAKYNSQSTANNTSSISVQLRLYGNGSYGSFSSGSCGISGIYNPTSGTTSYSTSLGYTSYSNGSEKTLATYTYSVHHSSTGAYSDTITYKISSSGSVSGSGNVSIALPTIKRVATMSSSNDFTDESPPTITFSNPGGFTVYPYLIIKNSSGTTLLDYSYDTGYRTAVTSPYTWDFTRPAINSTTYSSMLEEILATCNTSNTYNVTLGIDTYNGSTKLGYSSLSNTMTIVNANPTVDNTYYEETDVALTTKGYTDFSYCVTNESKPSVEVSCSTLKSANVSSVVVSTSSTTSGYISQSITLSYDSTSDTYKGTFGTITGTLNDISFITTITDSRGNKATSTYTPILLNYKSISISSLEATRSNSTSGTITVRALGTWYGGTMLDDETNPCNIAYGIIEKDSGSTITYIDIDSSNITLNDQNNTWSINYTLPLEYSYQKAWSLTLTAGDLYNNVRKETTILKGIPTFSAGKSDLQINGELNLADEDGENNVEVFGLTGTPRYDSTQSYSAGDYCVYNGSLQKCTGTTTGTFDSTKWEATDIMNEIKNGSGAKVTTLWEGTFSAASTSSISWSQSKYDFDTLRIVYKLDNWGNNASQFVDVPNNKAGMNNVNLSLVYGYTSSRQQIRNATLDIYEKSASWESSRVQHRDLSTSAVTAGGNATSGATIAIIGIYGIGGSGAVAKTEENNYIVMHLPSSQSFSNSYAKLNLTTYISSGTRLAESSGQVLIGSGVRRIKVSGTFAFSKGAAGDKYMRITKNYNASNLDGTTITMQLRREPNTGVSQLVASEIICNVTEGDLIGMYVYGGSGDTARQTLSNDMLQTYMKVEVID